MKRFAVIGLGKFGFQIAKSLYEEGNEVVAIDNDKNQVDQIAPYCTEAILLDARDREKLAQLGLQHMDTVVISTGTSISTSILLSLHMRELGVRKVLVKALDDDHAKILKLVGATDTMNPEKDMAKKVARGLSTPNVLDFIPLEEDFSLVQITPPPGFIGHSLAELNLRANHNVFVIGIRRPSGIELVPSADASIKADDVLLILGMTQDIDRLKRT